VEAGSRWTRSSGDAPHLPLIRQTCHALGLDATKPSNRSTIGAVYGYLDALGVLAYRPGQGPRYAYLAYGPVALAGRSLAAPAHRVSGGIPQHYGRGSTPALGETSRESIREEKTLPAVSRREPVAQSAKRETSPIQEKQEPQLSRPGRQFLDALVGDLHPKYRARLDGYEKHGALLTEARKWGALIAKSEVRDAHTRAVSRLNLGGADLDAAKDLRSLLAHLLGKHYTEAEGYLARHRAAELRAAGSEEWSPKEVERRGTPMPADLLRQAQAVKHQPVEIHAGESPDLIRGGAEPVALGGALADLTALTPEPVGADPRTAVAVGAIAAGSAIAEVRPAYETEEPYRTRLIRDAVRLGQHLGYGVPEGEAVAIHAGYLDLRQAGSLDPERDLYEIQTALGRPLHLAEVALYGVSLRVSAAEWERAETSTYSGGAAVPEPVEVREVSLAGTAVAP
jgi:hypothetical protein